MWRWAVVGLFAAFATLVGLILAYSPPQKAWVERLPFTTKVIGFPALVLGLYLLACVVAFLRRFLSYVWLRFRCAPNLADDFLRSNESYEASRAENELLRQNLTELQMFASVGRAVLVSYSQTSGLPVDQSTSPLSLPGSSPVPPQSGPANPQEPEHEH